MTDDVLLARAAAALGDDYEIEAEIGRGGMAVVYRARDKRLRRHVAVKVLPPDLAFRQEIRSRFLREAETAAGLSHPNIVPIYSVGERDGVVFFAMGLVRGRSLAEQLHEEPRLPVARVREILRETADALACAHRRGVVHRDIKPDNILLDAETGRAMVTDFGIARAAEAGQRLTQTGIAVGTPTYMSPEQAMGERDVDGRADIYSLGVVGYQMLAGRPPFEAASTPAMLVKHISERPPAIDELRKGLPRNLVSAVERALSKAPGDRWPDAAAFRDALAETAAAPPPVPEGTRRKAPQEITPPEPPRTAAEPRRHAVEGDWGSIVIAGGRDAGRDRAARDDRGQPDMEPPRDTRRGRRQAARGAQPVAEQIAGFQRHMIGAGAGIFTCWVVNLATSADFLWAIFPTLGIGMGVVGRGASLWTRGVPLRQLFSHQRQLAEPGEAHAAPPLPAPSARDALPSASSVAAQAAQLASPETLAGPHGGAVRRAVEDRATIHAIIQRLPAPDRALLPEVGPTVDALLQRVAALAATLHRLSADVDPTTVSQLDARLAALGEGGSSERERTRALLQRQRASIADLLDRRERLAAQLESAVLALQNLKLDLLKLRSAGVAGAIDGVTSATQEARALSRDIAHVLDAAAEVRGI